MLAFYSTEGKTKIKKARLMLNVAGQPTSRLNTISMTDQFFLHHFTCNSFNGLCLVFCQVKAHILPLMFTPCGLLFINVCVYRHR